MSDQTLRLPVEKTAVPALSGVCLRLARYVWVLLAVAALALLAVSLPGYASMFGGQLGFATHTVLPPGSRFFAAAAGIASLASALLSLGLSALLFRQKFTEFIAALLSFFFLLYGVVLCGPLEFAADYWLGSTAFVGTVQGLLLSTPFIALLLLFPNGRFVLGWTRWVLLLSVPWSIGLLWVAPSDNESFSRSPLLASIMAALFVVFALVGIYAQFYRYRRAATYNERQQIRWAVYGFALWIAYILLSSIPYYHLTSLPPGGPMPWWGPASIMGWFLSLNILPVCLTIAITRYQLWNIDLVVNRTLVYAALTVSVAFFYGVVVSTTGYFLQTNNNLAGLLLTAVVVIIVFRPLRANVQRGVDMLVGSTPTTGSLSPAPEPATAEPEIPEEVEKRPYRSHLFLIAAAGLLIGVALTFIGVHLTTPFANGRLQPGTYAITARGVIVTPLEAGPTGLQTGDVVTAVNGRSLETWLQNPGRLGQVGETISLTILNAGEQTPVAVTLARYPLGAILRRGWGALVFRLFYLFVALYVYARRPNVPAARILFLAAAAQFSAIPWSIGVQVGDFVNGVGLWLYFLGVIGGFMLAWVTGLHFALIFPHPLPILRRRRWLLPLLYGFPYLTLAVYLPVTRAQATTRLDWLGRWEWFTGPHAALYLSLTFGALIWQYRRHRHGPARRQMRWLGLGGLVVAGAAVLFYFLPLVVGGQALDVNVMGLIGLLFPLTIAIAILRHNLFDIDTLLNRALVYGGLTAVVILVYVLVVGVLGTILQAQGNLFVALVATGLAAVLFQPLRDRLQKTVNRFMYGERDEPFEVLARLGERLESTLSPEMVYPTIVETVSQALKLPYTAVAVWRNGQWETVESYGKPVTDFLTYPLTYQGEMVGQLLVARRAPDEPFSPADERILRNVARQAGAAVHAVQLMADLQQSRQQLVTTREEERRRLRRDLHDGLGPQLASQMLTIDVIDKLLARNPERARTLLHDLKAQSKSAMQDIRRLVYNLRPPALDELGLIGALREGAARQSQDGLRMTVKAPLQLPMLPAAVEVAAFRIAQEAMTNVVRHAAATVCTVQLALEQTGATAVLHVTVQDDGRGLPDDYQAGVGLQSMRERAAELGGVCRLESLAAGGVCVTAVLPIGNGLFR